MRWCGELQRGEEEARSRPVTHQHKIRRKHQLLERRTTLCVVLPLSFSSCGPLCVKISRGLLLSAFANLTTNKIARSRCFLFLLLLSPKRVRSLSLSSPVLPTNDTHTRAHKAEQWQGPRPSQRPHYRAHVVVWFPCPFVFISSDVVDFGKK